VSKKKPFNPKKQKAARGVTAKRTDDGAWELVHPRCAKARRDDLKEVDQMIEAGETEIARDELLWLLQDCHDCIDAHAKLGELALLENDLKLARGHFGYAYQIGLKAIDGSGGSNQFPYNHPANQSFHEASKGLVHCLVQLGKQGMARDIVKRLKQLDPSDPLRLVDTLEGKVSSCQEPPIVELKLTPPPSK
jgi:hypothetical protein